MIKMDGKCWKMDGWLTMGEGLVDDERWMGDDDGCMVVDR